MANQGINGFISSVAAAIPTPGGGSVAALAGSLAAALGEMMAGLTEGRQKFASAEPQVREIHEKLINLRKILQVACSGRSCGIPIITGRHPAAQENR